MDGPSFHPRIARKIGFDRTLVKQVQALANDRGCLTMHMQTDWRSATYDGVRHQLTLAFDGNDEVEHGELLAAELAYHTLSVPGRIVADARVARRADTDGPVRRLVLELDILLLEDN